MHSPKRPPMSWIGDVMPHNMSHSLVVVALSLLALCQPGDGHAGAHSGSHGRQGLSSSHGGAAHRHSSTGGSTRFSTDATMVRAYWSDRGLVNPTRQLREVADWSLLYFNATNELRPVLLITVATPSSVKGVLPKVLENLDSFKREDQIDTNGWATSLAEHTIVLSTNHEAHEGCRRLSEKFKNKCFEFEHGFNNGVQDHFTLNTQHAANIGLSRIKVLTDLVSLGYDIFYFDLHQYFFQHPLKYLYANTKGSIVVSSTKCVAAQQNADGSLPDNHHHLDLIFLRSNPAAFRCLYNWLYWSSYSQHDALAENKPLDHHTFRQSVQECVMALGKAIITVEYLSPSSFPSECFAKCGCKDGMPLDLQGDRCPQDVASQWVAFRFSCSGSAQRLEELIEKYKKIYSLSTDASAQSQATAGRLLRAAQGTAQQG